MLFRFLRRCRSHWNRFTTFLDQAFQQGFRQVFQPLCKNLGLPQARSRMVAVVTIALGLMIGLSLATAWSYFKTDAEALHLAIAAPLSGDRHESGVEMVQSVRLYINAVNQRGGIDGKRLKLMVYDDANSPEQLQQLPAKIAASPALIALGHLTSQSSLAAAPGYQQQGLPVITATASADALTKTNSYYFRAIFTNSRQGNLLALYAKEVLGFKKASIIYADDPSGQSLKEGFERVFRQEGTIRNTWMLPAEVDHDQSKSNRQIQQPTQPQNSTSSNSTNITNTTNVIDALAKDSDLGILFFAMNPFQARDTIVAIRRRGLKVPLLGNDSFATEGYPAVFKDYQEEQAQPGYFINGMRFVVPLSFDSANTSAQDFASDYEKIYGEPPTYVGAFYYNAAKVAIEAIRQAKVRNVSASRGIDRQEIRRKLVAMNGPETAVQGLTGPIYFNQNNDSNSPLRFARFVGRSIVSTSTQLSMVVNPNLIDLDRELELGNIVTLSEPGGQDYFWKQEVVYTGIDVNQLIRVDESKSTFTADFYFWLRYSGKSTDALAIDFPMAVANSTAQSRLLFDPNQPIKTMTIDGLNYRLYQIRGEFKGNYDFRDYPFDRQDLKIYFQNMRVPSDRLIYVVDTFGLKPKQYQERASKVYRALQLWDFKAIQYAQETLSNNSTRGNPKLFNVHNQIDYPGLSLTITLQRRFKIFLIKTLLPLALLVLVLYSTLHFSENLISQRLGVAISALLSSAFLLTAINAQLSDVGYTVAIEYGFYTFFGLCLFCILTCLLIEKLYRTERKQALARVYYFSRVFYILIVLATITSYSVCFSDRL